MRMSHNNKMKLKNISNIFSEDQLPRNINDLNNYYIFKLYLKKKII